MPSECGLLLLLRKHRGFGLHYRDDVLHQVFDIWFVADVPSCQVGDSYFVLRPNVRPLFGDTRVQLLIDVDFGGSDRIRTNQNNFDREAHALLQLYLAFEHQEIVCLLLARELHRLNTWLEVRIVLHEGNSFLLYDFIELLVVYHPHPLLNLLLLHLLIITFINYLQICQSIISLTF